MNGATDLLIFSLLYSGFMLFNWTRAIGRDAFRLDRGTGTWLKFTSSFGIIVVAPVAFWLLAYPVVSRFVQEATSRVGSPDVAWVVGHVLLVLYWIAFPFGCQQSWLLIARPRGWTGAPEVLAGDSRWWWTFLIVFVAAPTLTLGAAWFRVV